MLHIEFNWISSSLLDKYNFENNLICEAVKQWVCTRTCWVLFKLQNKMLSSNSNSIVIVSVIFEWLLEFEMFWVWVLFDCSEPTMTNVFVLDIAHSSKLEPQHRTSYTDLHVVRSDSHPGSKRVVKRDFEERLQAYQIGLRVYSLGAILIKCRYPSCCCIVQHRCYMALNIIHVHRTYTLHRTYIIYVYNV